MRNNNVPLIDVVRAIFWVCILVGFLLLKHIFPEKHILVQYSTGFYGVFIFFVLMGIAAGIEVHIAQRSSKKKRESAPPY
ncbi:hypothetical protein VU01_10496 [Candidatus Electrothrix marina]|uniref:Uncharacterized protein n=1 Tax=Candidatus Electrothrix marina TaxID=1859130 RepID=A0A444JG84_9BACT|nr:hypothetical protein VU01_10496 [Candidatus Electrothrix marina]